MKSFPPIPLTPMEVMLLLDHFLDMFLCTPSEAIMLLLIRFILKETLLQRHQAIERYDFGVWQPAQ